MAEGTKKSGFFNDLINEATNAVNSVLGKTSGKTSDSGGSTTDMSPDEFRGLIASGPRNDAILRQIQFWESLVSSEVGFDKQIQGLEEQKRIIVMQRQDLQYQIHKAMYDLQEQRLAEERNAPQVAPSAYPQPGMQGFGQMGMQAGQGFNQQQGAYGYGAPAGAPGYGQQDMGMYGQPAGSPGVYGQPTGGVDPYGSQPGMGGMPASGMGGAGVPAYGQQDAGYGYGYGAPQQDGYGPQVAGGMGGVQPGVVPGVAPQPVAPTPDGYAGEVDPYATPMPAGQVSKVPDAGMPIQPKVAPQASPAPMSGPEITPIGPPQVPAYNTGGNLGVPGAYVADETPKMPQSDGVYMGPSASESAAISALRKQNPDLPSVDPAMSRGPDSVEESESEGYQGLNNYDEDEEVMELPDESEDGAV